ncbi:hypothetical protein BJ508DRAFT_301267 [Ascobolus immersus RN42]|uniref:Biogenesis of lysosome-related organelles complex 1 subunit 1 n=1 Tax=Ascobolus immersus RN42 TaxID=1160509 RepID=A0A3N4IZS9_ASCIM|nr:hypothetical protein BJ508DRAFT_301267 [Ascobolus immersus RN42]
MATSLYNQSASSRSYQMKSLDAANRALAASFQPLAASLEAPLKAHVQQIHQNAKALDQQTKNLERETAKLSRQTKEWNAVVNKTSRGLKEIGDVQNWAEMIERELAIVEETLRIVDEGEDISGILESAYHQSS